MLTTKKTCELLARVALLSALLGSAHGVAFAQAPATAAPTTATVTSTAAPLASDPDAVKEASRLRAINVKSTDGTNADSAGSPPISMTPMNESQDGSIGPVEVVPRPTPPPTKPLVTAEMVNSEDKAVRALAEIISEYRLNTVSVGTYQSEGIADETTATALFNEKEVRRLLSEDPNVVYRVEDGGQSIPDPMIIPWMRQSAILNQRFQNVAYLIEQRRIQEARVEARAIIEEFPDTEEAKQCGEILARLDRLPVGTPEPVKAPVVDVEIVLNPNVKASAVVIDGNNPKNNKAMISGRVYSVDQTIRGLPNHRVKEVSDGAVSIEVTVRGKSKVFTVPVRVETPEVEIR